MFKKLENIKNIATQNKNISLFFRLSKESRFLTEMYRECEKKRETLREKHQ